MTHFLARVIRIWDKICLIIKLSQYRRSKKTIVISNQTRQKLFLERKPGDFIQKKAIKISPKMTLTIVVRYIKEKSLILRDSNRPILEIKEPVFQIVVNDGKDYGTYDMEEID